MSDIAKAQAWYNALYTVFTVVPTCIWGPLCCFFDAPFGRFSPKEDSMFLVDGIKSWIAFELVIPSALIWTYVKSPLTGITPPLSLMHPPTFVASLIVIHYVNRAIISPLRTPSRSKTHLSVCCTAISFNSINGFLQGAYLSSAAAQAYLADAFSRPLFWVGVGIWAFGLVGNIVHDEILLDIRRNNKAMVENEVKEKADADTPGKRFVKREHYAIPYGYLYRYISYPNYFCEWIEWLGYGLAAAPLPSLASPEAFLSTLAPPHFFFINEIFLMLPRAYRGHRWYHKNFPNYPSERKAVIPFVILTYSL